VRETTLADQAGTAVRARLLVGGLVLTMVLGASVRPAKAADGAVSIGNGGADGEVAGGFYTNPFMYPIEDPEWVPVDGCRTGTPVLDGWHWAIEFPLDALPADATNIVASLALRTANPERAGQTAIYGYAGDGVITAADVVVTGVPVLFTPTTSAVRESWDVTALLTPAVRAAGWAGFSLRPDRIDTMVAIWDCPGDALYPILTIEYTVPDPSPTPTPSPTKPPAAVAPAAGGPTPPATATADEPDPTGGSFLLVLLVLAAMTGAAASTVVPARARRRS